MDYGRSRHKKRHFLTNFPRATTLASPKFPKPRDRFRWSPLAALAGGWPLPACGKPMRIKPHQTAADHASWRYEHVCGVGVSGIALPIPPPPARPSFSPD